MRGTVLGIVAIVALGISLVSCGDGPTTPLDITFPSPMKTAPAARVEIVAGRKNLFVGDTTPTTVTISDSQGRTLLDRAVVYSSEDPTIATISSKGVITALSAGTVSVRATSGDVTGRDTVVVDAAPSSPPAPVPASLRIILESDSLTPGQLTTGTPVVRDASENILTGLPVAWESSDPSVANVDSSGKVSAIGIGTTIISATSLGVTGSAALRVTASGSRVASVVVTLSSSSVRVGSTVLATAVVLDKRSTPITGLSVTWSIASGPGVASISPTGVVTGLSGGTATVRATVDGVSGDAVVTVTSLSQIVLTPTAVTLSRGATAQFTVSGTWSDGSTTVPAVTYSGTGGSITATGLYTADTTAGTFRVIATEQGGTKADTATVMISAPAPTLTTLVLSPDPVTVQSGANQQFSITGSWSDGSSTKPAVTYSAGGGTITADGLYAAGAIPGLFKVIATQQGGTKSDTSMLTITPPPATALAIVVQPSGAVSGMPFTQQPVIELRDAQNHPVLQSGVQVTASKASGSGTLQGTVTSTTNAQGRSAFVNLTISGTGSHTIAFTAPGLTSVTSATLTVTASTLRSLAAARGFLIGAAVRDSAFSKDSAYRQTLARQYNSIVPEDATDFWPIHPGPSQYNFAAADALVAFAQANGMVFHGHHLAWHAWIPTWVTTGGYTDAQIRGILKDHIMTVVGRYRGKAASWDVVNEVIDNQGCFTNNCGLTPSFWLSHLGPEYIDSAFVWAHRADPTAKLYLNEFRTETIMNKSDAVFDLVKGLKSRGIPIDGVGFQVHILQQFWPAPSSADVQANFQRFADAGFDIRITEMDVAVSDTGGDTALTNQATVYENILNACLNVSRCKELTTWGFSDRYSWVPISFPGYGRALPFDSNYQPKPAFSSMLMRLGQP